MKAYLISVVLISALVSLCSHFLGEAGGQRFGRLAVGIVLLWAVISPLTSLSIALPALPPISLPPAEGEDAPLFEKRAEEAFCEGIRAAVCEKFSMKGECVSVRVEDFSVEKMRAGRILILLKGEEIFRDSFAIAAFVEGEGLGECEVEIEFGGS